MKEPLPLQNYYRLRQEKKKNWSEMIKMQFTWSSTFESEVLYWATHFAVASRTEFSDKALL